MNYMENKGQIFYDGLCRACSLEIDHYRKLPGSDRFEFTDITKSDFDAKSFGLDPFKVHKVMHVKSPDGKMNQGVDAFIAIWKELPRYQWLASLAKRSVIRSVLELGYQGFVIIHGRSGFIKVTIFNAIS